MKWTKIEDFVYQATDPKTEGLWQVSSKKEVTLKKLDDLVDFHLLAGSIERPKKSEIKLLINS